MEAPPHPGRGLQLKICVSVKYQPGHSYWSLEGNLFPLPSFQHARWPYGADRKFLEFFHPGRKYFPLFWVDVHPNLGEVTKSRLLI